MDVWELIETDRLAFAEYLASLSGQDWEAPSWCDDWTVKGVTTHLLVTPTMSKGQVFLAFLKSGFNLDKMSAKLVRQMTVSMSNAQIVTTTRETAGVRSAPPGLKPIGVFGELLVHSNDISMALGKSFKVPLEHYVIGLDHYKDVQPVLGCKKRIAGLQLRATDASWSTGAGPLVEGDAQSLLSAMTGRTEACRALNGDGVEILRSR